MNKFENYMLVNHEKLTCGPHNDIFFRITQEITKASSVSSKQTPLSYKKDSAK